MSTSGSNFNIYREEKKKTQPLGIDANKFHKQGSEKMLALQEKVATWPINRLP